MADPTTRPILRVDMDAPPGYARPREADEMLEMGWTQYLNPANVFKKKQFEYKPAPDAGYNNYPPGGYPPQQPGYPPQQPGYPPGYPPQPGYPPAPPQQPGYPLPQPGYPPAPPQQPGYLPQPGYAPQPGYPLQPGYPPQPGRLPPGYQVPAPYPYPTGAY